MPPPAKRAPAPRSTGHSMPHPGKGVKAPYSRANGFTPRGRHGTVLFRCNVLINKIFPLTQMPTPTPKRFANPTALAAIQQHAVRFAQLGFRVLPVAGKRALLSDWPAHATADAEVVRRWFDPKEGEYRGRNYGIMPPEGTVFVDIDPRNHAPALSTLNLPKNTLWQHTGGGGWHVLVRLPTGITLGKRPGVDIKRGNAYVVGAGCLHPDTGKPYILKHDVPSIDAVPTWKIPLGFAESDSKKSDTVAAPVQQLGREELRALYRDMKALPSTDYQNWIDVGQALHLHTNGSDDGFSVWNKWSATAPNYAGEEGCRAKWDSFNKDAAAKAARGELVQIGTVLRRVALAVQTAARRAPADEFGEAPPATAPLMALPVGEVPLRDPDYLFHGMAERGEWGVMGGAGGTGKGFLALGAAISVVLGRSVVTGEGGILAPAHGVCGRVLLVTAEDSLAVLRRRLEAWATTLMLEGDTLRRLHNELHVLDAHGSEIVSHYRGLGGGGGYEGSEWAEEFTEYLVRHPYDLVVLDPYSTLLGKDINDVEATIKAVNAFQNMAKATKGVVMTVAHVSKTGNRAEDFDAYALTGASALTNSARWVVGLRKPSPQAYAALQNAPDRERLYSLSLLKTDGKYIPPQLLEKDEHTGVPRLAVGVVHAPPAPRGGNRRPGRPAATDLPPADSEDAPAAAPAAAAAANTPSAIQARRIQQARRIAEELTAKGKTYATAKLVMDNCPWAPRDHKTLLDVLATGVAVEVFGPPVQPPAVAGAVGKPARRYPILTPGTTDPLDVV